MTFAEAIDEPLYLYAAVLLVLLVASILVIRSFKKELIPVFSDEEGLVQITPHALHELVRKTCEAFPEVNSPSTRIRKDANEIRLDIHIKVKPDCNVKDTRTLLRERLETVMITNLNFSNFGGVDIVIKGFQEEA
jgi:divalent metal cation (Fe/Co/Zn/Cd) transporter